MSLTLTLPGPSAGVSGSLDSYCSLKPLCSGMGEVGSARYEYVRYVSGSLDSYCSLKALCSGMGEVVPARTSPTLLPPSPRTVLSLSCFVVFFVVFL